MRRLVLILLVLLVAGCAQRDDDIPTLAVLPTVTPLPALTIAPTRTPAPIHPATVAPLDPVVTPSLTLTPTSIPSPTDVVDPIAALERRLRDTPILLNFGSDQTRAIFEQGRAAGMRPDVFTTVGDSNTTNGDFLQPIGMNADAYCTWGDFAYLRETVAYFSTAPSAAASTSFTHHSAAAQMGFNSAAVLDPFWAGGGCHAGESPLVCEYRTIQPAAAVIMLGGIDVNTLTTAEYAANLQTIVRTSIDHGIIPILTTFVVLPERGDLYPRSLEFNAALLDIAAAAGTPLINLWAAAEPLPDHGIGPDRTHLRARVGSFCSFDGAQHQLGGTLRNLLTLQALDALRTNILTR